MPESEPLKLSATESTSFAQVALRVPVSVLVNATCANDVDSVADKVPVSLADVVTTTALVSDTLKVPESTATVVPEIAEVSVVDRVPESVVGEVVIIATLSVADTVPVSLVLTADDTNVEVDSVAESVPVSALVRDTVTPDTSVADIVPVSVDVDDAAIVAEQYLLRMYQ